jgi:ceramide glucosyltransferase
VILHGILAALAFLSLGLALWQWLTARRFPLHRRSAERRLGADGALPALTVLKPLKDCDKHTEACLRSWFAQDYAGEIQLLFGVDEAGDPVCEIVSKLCREFPQRDAQLVVCAERRGANAKVSKLAQLQPLARHDVLVVSDADVFVPPDLMANLVSPLPMNRGAAVSWQNAAILEQGNLRRSAGAPPRFTVGLVSCFYQLANPSTTAMRCEAVAINADFWSRVLQARDLQPQRFALGAAMAVRRETLEQIGGFAAFADHLADDYQLGNRVARAGWRIELCPVVVECREPAKSWRQVWVHQIRWARTIRVCQPLPYFFSILSNATLWPLLLLLSALPAIRVTPGSGDLFLSVVLPGAVLLGGLCLSLRGLMALDLQRRLTQSRAHFRDWWLVPVNDLMQAAVWLLAFTGSRIEWRGERYRLQRDGRLLKT